MGPELSLARPVGGGAVCGSGGVEPGPKSGVGNMFIKSCPGPGDAYPLEEE